MSIKNQRPLLISSAVIIGLTITSLFGLNLVVDRISKISPPTVAMAEPPAPAKQLGSDDAVEKPNAMPPRDGGGHPDLDRKQMQKAADARAQPDDAFRRVRNGKDSPEIRRNPSSSSSSSSSSSTSSNGGDNSPPPSQKAPPAYPPSGGNYPPPPPYPMPYGGNMSPQEREQMEREFERQREMYGPPPGYMPPPYPPQGPNGYDGWDGYDPGEDYYGDEYDGYEGKLEETEPPRHRTAEVREQRPGQEPAHNEDDPIHEDDYVAEGLDEQ